MDTHVNKNQVQCQIYMTRGQIYTPTPPTHKTAKRHASNLLPLPSHTYSDALPTPPPPPPSTAHWYLVQACRVPSISSSFSVHRKTGENIGKRSLGNNFERELDFRIYG